MEKVDFLIVGSGLAGITLAHTLHQQGKSFKIISKPELSSCSAVAPGIFNPVVFYRITKSYMADLVLPYALDFYGNLEKVLNAKIFHEVTMAKIFASADEKKLWEKRREEGVGIYLGECLEIPDKGNSIRAEHGLGLVKHTGNIDCESYLSQSLNYFRNHLQEELFDYNKIIFKDEEIEYKNILASKIIFCEGNLMGQNPFFNTIPLKPVKGETITIQFKTALPKSIEKCILVKKCYLLPQGNNIYRVGATYDWTTLNDIATEEALNELTQNVKDITDIEFTVINQRAGVRPAATDRRPIIGVHLNYPQLHIFNGLGTKGVMLAPYFSNELKEFMLYQKPIHKEYNISRFYKIKKS